MMLRSEVVLSMLLNSLPSGGMITRSGLREDDPAHRLPVGHAQRLGRLGLARVHREDAGPDDLAHVGALVDARGPRGPPGSRPGGPAARPSMWLREEVEAAQEIRRAEVDQEDLDEDRGAPEEPDVDAADRAEDPVLRHAAERREDAQHDADQLGDHGHVDRDDRARRSTPATA